MNNKNRFLKTNKAGFVLGAALLAVLTGGVGNTRGQNVVITVPPPVVVAPPVVVIQDDYVYYPTYGVYFNSHRHQYYYLRGDVWVTQPAPEGVSVEVLLASPSVNMEFHDSPERHHAEMLQRYPRNWKHDDVHQDGKEDQGRKENRKEDRKDAAPGHDKK